MTETPNPAGTPEGADPSMEDILASIRRILNEEEAPATAESAAETPVDDDVLMLDESMMVSAGEPELEAAVPEPQPEPPAPPRIEPPRPEAEAVMPAYPPVSPPPEFLGFPALTPELVAPETAAAAASSVSSLMRTLAVGRATQVYSGGPTLEDMVRAELRPLLKEWLDIYLPPLVERLVRTEIERVVGRAVP
jgi:cell pole-organizing protein PopZ